MYKYSNTFMHLCIIFIYMSICTARGSLLAGCQSPPDNS